MFLARDRVGKKPLFYTVTPAGEFVFGSEIKVLLTHGGVEREIDPGALDAYLTFGYVPEEHSHYYRLGNGTVTGRSLTVALDRSVS